MTVKIIVVTGGAARRRWIHSWQDQALRLADAAIFVLFDSRSEEGLLELHLRPLVVVKKLALLNSVPLHN